MRLTRIHQMQRSGIIQFAGRCDGIATYLENKQVYFWNGSDVRHPLDKRGPAMHLPGEVVS